MFGVLFAMKHFGMGPFEALHTAKSEAHARIVAEQARLLEDAAMADDMFEGYIDSSAAEKAMPLLEEQEL